MPLLPGDQGWGRVAEPTAPHVAEHQLCDQLCGGCGRERETQGSKDAKSTWERQHRAPAAPRSGQPPTLRALTEIPPCPGDAVLHEHTRVAETFSTNDFRHNLPSRSEFH